MLLTEDTIAAISTPAGAGPRAIVRVSGPDALELGEAVFEPLDGSLAAMAGFSAADGVLRLEGGAIELAARVYVFRGPRSYTRQDLLELHVPGSPVVAAAALAELVRRGARAAEAGEFTARAFFNGRISLAGAETVAATIDAESGAQLRAARQAQGRLEELCRSVTPAVTDILAAVEASIDVADEDLAIETPGELAEALAPLAGQLRALANQAGGGDELAAEPAVVLVGRPNVGKSSLLNALAGTDRAIVSAMAGTTRDVLSCPVDLAGRSIRLQDAAGFEPAATPLDALAHNVAREAVAAADVVLIVTDAASPQTSIDAPLLAEVQQLNPSSPRIWLLNKCDLRRPASGRWQGRPASDHEHHGREARRTHGRDGHDTLEVSARTGRGLAQLRVALENLLGVEHARPGGMLGLRAWQGQAVSDAADALGRAADVLVPAADVADVAELASVELRVALRHLAVLAGQVTSDDVLGRIFARFCVGK
jgi:tRNA modification GTPase